MARDLENQKKLAKEWYLRNKELTIARAKAWQKENAEAKREIRKRWRDQNTGYNAQYYLDHKEEIDVANAEWRDSHRAEMRQYRSNWQKAHPESALIHSRRRRDARKKWGNLEGLNQEQTQFIYAQFENQCFLCGASTNLALDHHYPIDVAPLCLGNAVLLCKICNSSKNNKYPEDFYSFPQLRYLQTILSTQKQFSSKTPDTISL